MMKRYLEWIRTRALPTWATLGYDDAAGRFHERLDARGRPLDVPLRAMVQARQIYVFAHAAELGWHGAGEKAERAMATMIRDFCVDSGGRASFAFSIGGEGRIVSDARDAYTHAFALFAMAWLHRLTGDHAMLGLADRTIAFIEAELTDPIHGGLFDAVPIADGLKRQNPLMHLLEAYLFLDRAAPERGYGERASGLVALFKQRLVRRDPGVLLEHFATDWGPHPDPAKATAWEPGHHFEWVWLLHEHGRLTGEDHEPWIAALHASARRHGVTPDGRVFDELSSDLAVTKRAYRVWPHTEAMKAAVARHRAGDPNAIALAETMAATLMRTFLDRPFSGGWIDHVDAMDRPLVDYAPASTLYHLFLAATEAASLAEAASPRTAEPVSA